MPAPHVEFYLYRHALTAWREAIQPWLTAGHGRLQRSYIVVPTRGQAQALKQRCLIERVPLLGVEFLSPGLARKKWATLVGGETLRPAMGRELLLLGLGAIVERRLQALAADAPERGLLKSLQSDLERALDDFDDLLKAGFGPEDFSLREMRSIFAELAQWVEELGYAFAPRQLEAAAVEMQKSGARKIGGRVLVHGFGAEARGEFLNVATFARGFDDITVLIPEPEFTGRRQKVNTDWAELWEKLLGVAPEPLIETDDVPSCENAVAGWAGGEPVVARAAAADSVIVGLTRGDEMRLVAAKIEQVLRDGAESIGVIFPRADAAHLRLSAELRAREISFVDQVGQWGPPEIEMRLGRALIAFYEQGARLEEFLTLWPLVKAIGLTELSLGDVRDVCERLFDEKQNHALEVYREMLDQSDRPAWQEVGRIAARLGSAWPAELTLGEALRRFEETWEALEQVAPEGWGALRALAEKDTRPLPAKVALAALKGFLPERTTAAGAAARNGFARVILTTRRRAEGVVWSHLFLTESNAGVWPERKEASCWLTDEQRAELNQRARPGLGLFTTDERAWFEKHGVSQLVRDTTRHVWFSAALLDESDTEMKLAPNSCLERLLWADALAHGERAGLEELFERRAQRVPERSAYPKMDTNAWLDIHRSRQDPAKPFDAYFFSVDPTKVRPPRLPARLIERAMADPAELWFKAVLQAERIEWKPFVRARKKALGQLAHRVLAKVLRTQAVERIFSEMPAEEDALRRLSEEMAKLREARPANRYWESFHAELEAMCEVLLRKVLALDAGRFVATEVDLPAGATIPLGPDRRYPVYGRVDLVRIDRTDWLQARVDVVDFKTGQDKPLSAERMAREGASLQLGVYLEAMRSVGAPHGRVHLLKPDAGDGGSIGMEDLPVALSGLAQLGRHLDTGIYGALTPEPSEYSPPGYAWPLAIAPVAEVVLRAKFEATFGEPPEGEEGAL